MGWIWKGSWSLAEWQEDLYHESRHQFPQRPSELRKTFLEGSYENKLEKKNCKAFRKEAGKTININYICVKVMQNTNCTRQYWTGKEFSQDHRNRGKWLNSTLLKSKARRVFKHQGGLGEKYWRTWWKRLVNVIKLCLLIGTY